MTEVADTAVPAESEQKAALLLRLRSQGIASIDVLRAMEAVPRDAFVPTRLRSWAARDIALPIGCGQTTAEPSLIARVLEALAPAPDSRVLEIGAGSGYVTALLAKLAADVVGIERYRGLSEAAQARLAAQGVIHARVAWGDGLGDDLPPDRFDRILVMAAVDEFPTPLLDRLEPDGVIVYPLRVEGGRQALVRATRARDGSIAQSRVCASRLQAAVPGRALHL